MSSPSRRVAWASSSARSAHRKLDRHGHAEAHERQEEEGGQQRQAEPQPVGGEAVDVGKVLTRKRAQQPVVEDQVEPHCRSDEHGGEPQGAGPLAQEVERATRLHIGDEVAVKVLGHELVENAVTRERFQREARAAARVGHPNAVGIRDFGEEPEGGVFIVVELVLWW